MIGAKESARTYFNRSSMVAKRFRARGAGAHRQTRARARAIRLQLARTHDDDGYFWLTQYVDS